MEAEIGELKPADLRGILKYVPRWRGHCFVFGIDAGLVSGDNVGNILHDLAVLSNLHIKVVLVYGIGHRIRQLAAERQIEATGIEGEGPVDAAGLDLAVEASGRLASEIVQGLTQAGMRCAITNAVRSTESGVLAGVDQLYRGKVEKTDTTCVLRLLENEIVPVFSPLAYTREGQVLRLRADELAAELAIALEASKLIYLVPDQGLVVDGKFVVNCPVGDLRAIVQDDPSRIAPRVRPQALCALRSVEGGVPRAHIVDGSSPDSLLTEIFHKVGVGTMIYGNDYQQIRPATRRDIPVLLSITQKASQTEELRPRTAREFNQNIHHFYVYEIDGSVIGCVCLRPFSENRNAAEIEALFVQSFYHARGVGKKLVTFALSEARHRGFEKVIALTTQSYGFFRNVLGFADGTPSDLPEERRQQWEHSQRNSKILLYRL
jgi:amino-acid N-acetyltransferase